MDQAFFREAGRRGGKRSSSQRWRSTVDGFVSLAAGVARHNIKRGWDPLARERVEPQISPHSTALTNACNLDSSEAISSAVGTNRSL